EIGFLPVPGTGGLPSATDCTGGFHSLAGAAAVTELARAHGLTGASAAELVRRAAAADTVRAASFLADLADRVALGA
ncbi:ROK family transcriptional regulator, partial [Streptomyces sp. SID89]|nr:ROK family transcriptional regulator [Streptomyces sp. SID89]